MNFFKKPKSINKDNDEEIKLPSTFIVSYLGYKEVYGHQRMKQCVSELFNAYDRRKSVTIVLNLTLEDMTVSLHHSSPIKEIDDTLKEPIPIQFISYVSQDYDHQNVFSCLVVRELSYTKKKVECHSFLCDSEVEAIRLGKTFRKVFELFVSSVKGEFQFKVDLQEEVNKQNGKSDTKSKHEEADA
ncbi:unnamed protein product [Dimorphilus gyrociliatus]|uniref:PID domain-containing protein n=1 Tax=Dimorphilus gyrociliatus TaxID=2664684 RepID=A0A7I8W4D1_9ANNE|nr:unnamed protein product [Dimorphilus gyrociliatus]